MGNRSISISCMHGFGLCHGSYVRSKRGNLSSEVNWFYIGMEGLSILENVVRLGVPFLEELKNILVQLKEGNKKGIKEETKIE